MSDIYFCFIAVDASPVGSLKCEGPNSGDAKLILNWTEPDGMYSGFQITVSNGSSNDTQNGVCCEHIISQLAYHSKYDIKVETQSCGKPSILQEVHCKTGVSSKFVSFVYCIFACM